MAARVDVERVRALMARATGDEKHDESSTSTLDALWVLYDRVLRVDPSSPRDETRDRFILSKGHGPSAYYAVLAAKGFFPEELLDGFLEWGNPLGSHPDRVRRRRARRSCSPRSASTASRARCEARPPG